MPSRTVNTRPQGSPAPTDQVVDWLDALPPLPGVRALDRMPQALSLIHI